MQSRLNKYYDDHGFTEDTVELPSRLVKNQELYKEVSSKELNSFDVNSNTSVLDNKVSTVDIEKIKEMLDRKSREIPKDKSIGNKEEVIESVSLDETREYDINNILEASHKNDETDYEEARLRKLRNTQMDILKNLDAAINEEEKDDDILPAADDLDDIKSKREAEERKLKELIDTITAQELISQETVKELDPLDLLSDLKGDDDDTKILGVERVEEEDSGKIDLEDTKDEEIKEVKTQPVKTELEDTNTNTLQFTQSDFDDFNDLKEDMRFTKILVRILIVIIVIVFIVGCVLLANKIFNLRLF
jgi:hypothetical protein